MAFAAVQLSKVTFSYDKKPFIKGLDQTVLGAQITSIVGPNGCGKSTVLKIMDGLITPQSGQARVNGVPTLEMDAKTRARHLALLLQGARPPAMSVEELASCGRYPYHRFLHKLTHEDKERVEEALTLTGIAHLRNQDVRTLSGGERQRAFIAMTLAQDTDIIALDEPTTYLDVYACHEIMQLVCMLNSDSGKTFIMVIHDLDLALRYSDHIIVMERGSCLCSGGVEEVLASGALDQAFKVNVRKLNVEGTTVYAQLP